MFDQMNDQIQIPTATPPPLLRQHCRHRTSRTKRESNSKSEKEDERPEQRTCSYRVLAQIARDSQNIHQIITDFVSQPKLKMDQTKKYSRNELHAIHELKRRRTLAR